MNAVHESGTAPRSSLRARGALFLLLCSSCTSPAPRAAVRIEARPVEATHPALEIESLHLAPSATIGVLGAGSEASATLLARHCPSGIVYVAESGSLELERLVRVLDRDEIDNVVPMFASHVAPHFPPGRLDLVLVERDPAGLDDPVSYLRRIGRALKLEGRLAAFERHHLDELLERAGFARIEGHDAELGLWRPRNQW